MYIKYPKTYHLPWSENIHSDDKMMEPASLFKNFGEKRVIVMEKMDGENTTFYRDYIHARSVDGGNHFTRDWVKGLWSQISHNIPEGWRVCGENLFAKHSIFYDDLSTYFMAFSIWNDKNVCLSWDDTKEWYDLIGVQSVPVLYDGIFDQKKIQALWNKDNWTNSEGYVIRVADEIPYSEFRYKVGKFVRKNHVQTVKHWMHGQRIEQNGLRKI